MTDQHKEGWGSRLGVILAVAGSAVGLGNFLRFPGNAAANGGGAFMIPYFCALLFLGIPIGWAEWTMGRYGGRKGFHSAPAILGCIGRGALFRYLGVIGVLIPLAVSFYYVFIESWCLGYCWQFLTGGIGVDASAPLAAQTQVAADFYDDFTGRKSDGVLVGDSIHPGVWFWVITFAVNVWFVFRGLSKGIERFCKWAMPTMAVAALIVLVRVLTLPPNDQAPEQDVNSGLGFMWNPDFGALTKPGTWLAAAGQIFFSLSVGFGVIINYASYCKRRDDVVLSGLTASATNELFEVGFGGMITIPAAFIFLGATGAMAAAQSGTFGLGFQTLPVVFANMPLGNTIAAIWFFMLFLAAITSSLSMLQPSIAFVIEALGCSRAKATTIVSATSAVGAFFVIWYSKAGVAWVCIDDWVGTLLIAVLAAVQIVCFSWIFGVRRGTDEAHEGAAIRIPAFFGFVFKYIAPVYLIVVIAGSFKDAVPAWIRRATDSVVEQMALGLVALVTIGLVVLTRIGEKRWRAMGLDVDGLRPPDDTIAAAPPVRPEPAVHR